MTRPWTQWPAWTCIAIDPDSGQVCNGPATWKLLPTRDAQTPWIYCNRHRPDGAEPITEDEPYYVTRLELRVAVTGAPGTRAVARDEAVRRIVYAIEAVGGLVTHLNVKGATAKPVPAQQALGRLELAGPPEPLTTGRSAPVEEPAGIPGWRWRRKRTG
jgi:hypothetical protein